MRNELFVTAGEVAQELGVSKPSKIKGLQMILSYYFLQ